MSLVFFKKVIDYQVDHVDGAWRIFSVSRSKRWLSVFSPFAGFAKQEHAEAEARRLRQVLKDWCGCEVPGQCRSERCVGHGIN